MRKSVGVYQLSNGLWGYRIAIKHNGKKTNIRRTTDQSGNKLKTKSAAVKARQEVLSSLINDNPLHQITRKTVEEVYDEYAEKGRLDKAYSTIRKQDSLWRNHLKSKFGSRVIDDISVAEINDYLSYLYYIEGRSFSYVESFLKMFYLIFGQAYSRNYMLADSYAKLPMNWTIRSL